MNWDDFQLFLVDEGSVREGRRKDLGSDFSVRDWEPNVEGGKVDNSESMMRPVNIIANMKSICLHDDDHLRNVAFTLSPLSSWTT